MYQLAEAEEAYNTMYTVSQTLMDSSPEIFL